MKKWTGSCGASQQSPISYVGGKTWNLESHFLHQPHMPQVRTSCASRRRPNAWAITLSGPMSAYCILSQASHSLMDQHGSSLSHINQSTNQLKPSALSQPARNVSSWVQASSMHHSSRRFCL